MFCSCVLHNYPETHCKAGNYVIRCLHSLCILCNENTAFVDWLCFCYAVRVLCLRFSKQTLKHIVKQAFDIYVACIFFVFCTVKILCFVNWLCFWYAVREKCLRFVKSNFLWYTVHCWTTTVWTNGAKHASAPQVTFFAHGKINLLQKTRPKRAGCLWQVWFETEIK